MAVLAYVKRISVSAVRQECHSDYYYYAKKVFKLKLEVDGKHILHS